jgi:hypothetical protein
MNALTLDEQEQLVAEMRMSGLEHLKNAADLISLRLMTNEVLKASIGGADVDTVVELMRRLADGPFGKLNSQKRADVEAEIIRDLELDNGTLSVAAAQYLDTLSVRATELSAIQNEQIRVKLDKLRSAPATAVGETNDA